MWLHIRPKLCFVNSISVCHLDIETCPAGAPVDFYVTVIISRNLRKLQIETYRFSCKFLSFLGLWSSSLDNLMVFQRDYAVMLFWFCVSVVKTKYKKLDFSRVLFVWKKQPNRYGISHIAILRVLFYSKQFGEETKVLWIAIAVQLHLLL